MMDKGTEHAYKWAKGQNYQSVAADYARILAIEIDRLNAKLAKVTRELEGAIKDMWIMRCCQTCKHCPPEYPALRMACKDCDDEDKWEWRGLVHTTPTDHAQGAEGGGEG